ncbi:TetR/AcrR family transcriptional regulator [Allokutzneria albata]|uniref:DNA-binding transcriptional regulator, AcrR family n=1 Tax=Allokutzneria albata TaxID=211114 RepID=A0A1G9ZVL0_ALLAB|nr:TetR/AcrR family transcriptional regulator [Allokutzneria albata]SDN25320.1 DNA-binding transcriptional regulator, AcrR family [Allokutzneria albata]
MTESTRRERLRADTEREILACARRLLVEDGSHAVTLRAIARELGITAPALYRYYDSRADLLRHVCDDISADLAATLNPQLAAIPVSQPAERVFAVCRGFRQWALAHPREFTLVFATSPEETNTSTNRPAQDHFGRVFLEVAGQLLSEHQIYPSESLEVPERVRGELTAYREDLAANLAAAGHQVAGEKLQLGTIYLILQWWARLYGHVALEVFGRFPFAVNDAEPLFESMLTELAAVVGFS